MVHPNFVSTIYIKSAESMLNSCLTLLTYFLEITSYTSDKVTDTDSAVRKVYSSIDAFHYEKAALEAKGDIDTSRVTSVQDLIPSHLLDCMPGTSAAGMNRSIRCLGFLAQTLRAPSLSELLVVECQDRPQHNCCVRCGW